MRKEITVFARLLTLVLSIGLLAGTLASAQPPAGGQGGFVPVDTLPAAEQLPVAPLLITAYAFVWVAVLFYVWTIWRRLNKVEGEMQMLEQRSKSR